MNELAKQWVEKLALIPHQEGGYYREMLRSEDMIGTHVLYTSIYFLLTEESPSHFHRLKSDEVWYYHVGDPLTIHMITPEGEYQEATLGLNVDKGEQLQFVVPKGTIFGSTVSRNDGFALVSCMVAPGFEYDEFELFDYETLVSQYPQYEAVIRRLTAS